MEREQEKRFKHLFKLESNSSDENGGLLFKVISLDANNCDSETELTYSDYKEFLYVANIKTIEENLIKLRENIIRGDKYHYVHSYGKNGKTTFNRRFIEENKRTFCPIMLDFKDFQIQHYGKKHSLMTKTIKAFNNLGIKFGEKLITTTLECLLHIQDTPMEIKIDGFNNDYRSEYNSLFSSISVNLIDFLNKILQDALVPQNNQKNIHQILFAQKFESFINNEMDERNASPIDLFNLLLLVYIKLYGSKEKRIIVFFDNIDDILTHSSEYLTSEILPQVDKFFTILNKYINHNRTFIDPKILDETSFVFTYRSANYVSSMFRINYDLSSASRKDSLLNAPTYVLSSVNATISILKRKLEFYNEICYSFHITKTSNYDTLKSILESFDNDDLEYKYISKLWNGNQFAFINCFKSLSLAKSDHSILINPEISVNLKRGAFIFYVVKFYLDVDNTIFREPTLTASFQYAFTNETKYRNDGICNLLRMFLTFIVNYNLNLRRLDQRTGNRDLFSHGVSLKMVLDKLTEFKSDGKIIYNKTMVKELFERIFYDDIDAFDYFITCVKNTSLNGKTYTLYGKKYNFSNELDIYFDNPVLNEEQSSYLDSIRIYANTNAKYFLHSIKKHFEYFSCTLPEGFEPLPYNIKIFNSPPEEDLFDDIQFQLTYNISINKILENVYYKVKSQVESTINFYLKAIYRIYPPLKYCQESNFALDGVFFYDDLISKHITYIEKVRQEFFKGVLPFEFQKNLEVNFIKINLSELPTDVIANVNARFVYWIEKYISIFDTSFTRIKEQTKSDQLSMDEHSLSTRKSFKILKQKIDKIKKSNFTDILTKIETTNE